MEDKSIRRRRRPTSFPLLRSIELIMTESSSPPSSETCPYTGEWEYDVFLCFRGDDTRLGFTSHLMNALSSKQIRTFIDDKLEKTESIDELVSILQRSALSVVVFSENFADSSWCLDEVATIAPRMTKFGHRILPVFYNVDPSDVTGDSGSYATIINREFKGKSTYSEDKRKWMDALKAVANCSGHTSQAIKIESELIKKIVQDVQKQMIDMSSIIKSANLVGMGSRILEVERLLAMDVLDDTRIIGLWGMGGVGKTTLAKACYGRITSSNKSIKHLFVRNITEICGKHQGVEEVVRKLYSKLLDENNQLALGDVTNLPKIFAAGSRIILTTRNKKVLQNAMTKIYDLECLNDEESTRLFSLHAFRQDFPRDNWTYKSRLAISYCKGNPLALKILGGALFGEDTHYWKSFLSGLRQTGQLEIQNILRKSYDTLGATEKKIFLDVACLLRDISRSRLITYMETMHPSSCAKVKDLIDRSLLTCVSSKNGEKIEVHDLLKEMAWNIVNEEPKLGKRSRLVDPDDIHKLLTTREVDTFLLRRKKRKVVDMDWKVYNPLEEHRTTRGICLDLSKAKEIYLESNAFDGMNSLTFLKIWESNDSFPRKRKIHLPYGGLDSLPNGLRWLQWDYYPSKFLPSKFYPQHLVHLIIARSPIQRCWKGYDQSQLVNLMVLNFSFCESLVAIPNISSSSNLEKLILHGCKSLVEVPSYVQYLTKLKTIDLSDCRNIKHLPPKLDSKLLKHVRMSGLKVTHIPENDSREFVELNLYRTSLLELPSAIYNIKQDGAIYLYGKNIINFPAITTRLKTLWLDNTSIREIDFADDDDDQTSSELSLSRFLELHLCRNSQLESLPKSIWNMVSSYLVVNGSPLLEILPEVSEPIYGLTGLVIIDCGSLKTLPSSISNIRSLESLDLSRTGIRSLPSSIHELGKLARIELRFCKSLESIPSSIHKLSRLTKLYMYGCESIRSLPELPPNVSELKLSGCKSLQALPSNTLKLLKLEMLNFEYCPQLDQTIPFEILTNFLVHASLAPVRKGEFLQSGSELPEWFSHKSMNLKEAEEYIVMMELPLPRDGDQSIIKGIVFGAVYSSHCYFEVRCDCEVGNTIISSWTFYIHHPDVCESDKLWLMFNKNLAPGKSAMGSEENEAWYVKYAGLVVSFKFYFERISRKKLKWKECGVSLLY
ncbi:Disease resistance-like protein DSC1 [Linum perenne]